MTSVSEIQTDADEVNDLLYAAKNGQWNKVWRILGHPSSPRKPFLLNCIPENRRWGVLHQAIWWNNYSVVKKLLQFATCDINIKAKEGTSEIGPTGGKSAEEIASGFGRTNIVQLLQKNISRIGAQSPQTYHLLSSEREEYALSLLKVTLAAYKTAFQPEVTESQTFDGLLQDVWRKINSVPGRWKIARDKVAEAAYVVCNETCNKIKACKNKQEFYSAIIKTYTIEENFLYDHLNTALRRQRQGGDYMPTADDLALGPYVLMYQLLLLFWNKLKRETCITYRRMRVTAEDLNKYQVGTKFAWMSFVSSSVELEKAIMFPTCGPTGDKVIVFTIDNSSPSHWQPRDIEKFAMYMERERVFPAGAKFLVTNRTQSNNQTNVSLKLLN